MIYLVSYPHSGNTWVRYCFEYLTGLPTHGHKQFSISERDNNFLNINIKENPIMIKRHTLEDITEKDVFVLLLRDPAECIKSDQDVNKEFLKYYSLIKGSECHKGPGGILYYNWIFDKTYFRNTINYFDFFKNKVNQNRLNLLINEWDYHLEKCKSIYNNETDKEGANLSDIPQILLEDARIKNSRRTVYT